MLLLRAVEVVVKTNADSVEQISAEFEESDESDATESLSAKTDSKRSAQPVRIEDVLPGYMLSAGTASSSNRWEDFYATSTSPLHDLSEFYEERKEISDAGYDLNFTPLDTVEAQKAMKDWQLSLVLGDVDHANYKTREKIANLFLFDVHFAIVLHDLNKVTDDIDFSRVV